MTLAVVTQDDALMNESFPVEPVSRARLPESVNSALFKQSRPLPTLDTLPRPAFQHHRFDALPMQQLREQ
ncbi:hypothetical protein GCM10027190_62090 [Spirosoma areae]